MIAAERCLLHAVACVLACLPLLAGCTRHPQGTNPYAPGYGTPPYGTTPYGAAPPQYGAAPYPAPPNTSVPPPGPVAPSTVPNLPPPPGSGAARGPFPSIERPTWSAPGTIGHQQQRAVAHDPYPDNDAGPEIVGGRPRDFQKPLAQPVRANPLGNLRWPF